MLQELRWSNEKTILGSKNKREFKNLKLNHILFPCIKLFMGIKQKEFE